MEIHLTGATASSLTAATSFTIERLRGPLNAEKQEPCDISRFGVPFRNNIGTPGTGYMASHIPTSSMQRRLSALEIVR